MAPKDSKSKLDGTVRKVSLLHILAMESCTLHRLAEMLRTSVRTLQRDIEECRQAGFAITMDEETKRLNLVSDYGLPSIDFTFPEILTIFISLQTGGMEYGPLSDNDISRASMKIASALAPEFYDLIADRHPDIHVVKGPKDVCPNGDDVMVPIFESMREGRILSIRYKSPTEKKEIQTTLSPYAVFYAHRGWYIIGYAELYGEIRTFKSIRILQIEKMKETFSRLAGFSLSDYLGNAWRLFREPGPDREVILRFTPMVAHNVAETRWHKTQENRWLSNDFLEVRFQVSGLREILFWILGYGAEVEVLQPPELRQMVCQHAQRMLDYYR